MQRPAETSAESELRHIERGGSESAAAMRRAGRRGGGAVELRAAPTKLLK